MYALTVELKVAAHAQSSALAFEWLHKGLLCWLLGLLTTNFQSRHRRLLEQDTVRQSVVNKAP